MYPRRRLFTVNHFLFLSMLAFGVYIFKANPVAAFWVVSSLVILGAILFVVAAVGVGKYQNIYDQEPTQFLGRATTGKRVRNILRNGMVLGGGTVLMGSVLLILN